MTGDPARIEEERNRQAERLMELAADFDRAIECLPEKEQRAYRESQQSIVDARRAGERLARELWIG